MESELKETLKNGARELGISLDASQIIQFEELARKLLEWNKVMNLTRITEPRDIVIKHFLDSLTLVKYTESENAKIIDVGCGAGFPGFPLLIAKKDSRVTFLDGTNKKLEFIAKTAADLHIESGRVQCVHGRAEEESKKPEYREKYDVAAARAVADLAVLAEYCLPFVKPGGLFVAMKGKEVSGELSEAENAIKILGGSVEKVDRFILPGSELERALVVIRKVSATPQKYPRISAKIHKKHL